MISALLAGFVGGVLGVISSIFTSYYGPRKFEEWKEKRKHDRIDGPRKKLLLNLLNGEKHKMRSIETLSRASGTTERECRRLLVEIEARGIRLKGNKEGWVLIKNKPLEHMNDDEVVEID